MFAATLGTRRDSADIQVSRLWTKPSIRNSSVQDSSFEDLLRGHTPLKQRHSRGSGAGACPLLLVGAGSRLWRPWPRGRGRGHHRQRPNDPRPRLLNVKRSQEPSAQSESARQKGTQTRSSCAF